MSKLHAELSAKRPPVSTPKIRWWQRFDRSKTSHLISLFAALTIFLATGYTLLTHYTCSQGVRTGDQFQRSWPDAILNGIYFSIATETTVGYGDLTPQGFSRALACFQALLGLGVAGLFISKITTGPSGKTRVIIERMSGAWIEFCETPAGLRISLINIRFTNNLLRYDGINFKPDGEYLGTFKGSSEPTTSLNGSEIHFDYSNEEGDMSVFSSGVSTLCFQYPLEDRKTVSAKHALEKLTAHLVGPKTTTHVRRSKRYNFFSGHAKDRKQPAKICMWGYRVEEPDNANLVTSFSFSEQTQKDRADFVRRKLGDYERDERRRTPDALIDQSHE